MQSSKPTHLLSKLKGPTAIYFNEVTQDSPFLKAVQESDGGRSSLSRICKDYKDSQESMVNGRDVAEMSNWF